MSVLKTYGASRGEKPSLTYRLHNGRLEGTIDGLEAVKQAVALLLGTERFRYPIYSADYGTEWSGLIGRRREYVIGDMRRILEEALREDDRIEGIRNFTMTFEGECAKVRFTVVSTFGEFEAERGWELG